MIDISYLDIMIQYSCNLSCKGCITMTDYNRKGWVSIREGNTWLHDWSSVIDPKTVCLFGGEPLLNRDLKDWISSVRQAWPGSTIKINTNGFYLDRVNLLDWLIGPSKLQISMHLRNDPRRTEIISKLTKMMASSGKQFKPAVPQDVHEQLRFIGEDLEIVVAEFGEFRKPYKGHGSSMQPAGGIPAVSHSKCGSPNNPILYKNKLYKCGPIANLADTLRMHNKLDDVQWSEHLSYTGYSIKDDLAPFVTAINRPEWICSMCPDDDTELIDHYAADAVKEKRHC